MSRDVRPTVCVSNTDGVGLAAKQLAPGTDCLDVLGWQGCCSGHVAVVAATDGSQGRSEFLTV
jgi:hypothetical protein